MAETKGSLKWEKFSDSDQQYVTLNSGYKMPLLGLGTSASKEQTAVDAVKHAITKAGYKHIDTAGMYGNEEQIGQGLKAGKREDIFLTTKLANANHGRVKDAVDEQLKALQIDYIDLYLMHWPLSKGTSNGGKDVDPPIKETWQEMEKLVDAGKVRSIGISNFSIEKTKDLLSYARVKPAVNQVEVHVWHRNQDLVNWCLNEGIQIQAYSPMGGTPLYKKDGPNTDPTVKEVAKKYGKTPNQVLLRWNLQHGSCVIPKSGNPSRIDENADIFGWSLDQADYDTLNSIKFQVRMCDGYGFIENSPYKDRADLWDSAVALQDR